MGHPRAAYWVAHGLLTGCPFEYPWATRRLPMGYPWVTRGLPNKGYPWNICALGLPVGYPRALAAPTVSTRLPWIPISYPWAIARGLMDYPRATPWAGLRLLKLAYEACGVARRKMRQRETPEADGTRTSPKRFLRHMGIRRSRTWLMKTLAPRSDMFLPFQKYDVPFWCSISQTRL